MPWKIVWIFCLVPFLGQILFFQSGIFYIVFVSFWLSLPYIFILYTKGSLRWLWWNFCQFLKNCSFFFKYLIKGDLQSLNYKLEDQNLVDNFCKCKQLTFQVTLILCQLSGQTGISSSVMNSNSNNNNCPCTDTTQLLQLQLLQFFLKA